MNNLEEGKLSSSNRSLSDLHDDILQHILSFSNLEKQLERAYYQKGGDTSIPPLTCSDSPSTGFGAYKSFRSMWIGRFFCDISLKASIIYVVPVISITLITQILALLLYVGSKVQCFGMCRIYLSTLM